MLELMEHTHFILRAEIENSDRIRDLELIEDWMFELIEEIDMKVLICPQAEYCDKTNNRGVTAIAAIETSHLALHIWDEIDPAVLQFDLYSCKDFDPKKVLTKINDLSKVLNYEYGILDRADQREFVLKRSSGNGLA